MKLHKVVLIGYLLMGISSSQALFFSGSQPTDDIQRELATNREFRERATQFMDKAARKINELIDKISRIEQVLQSGYQSQQDDIDKGLNNLAKAFLPRDEKEVDKYRNFAGNLINGVGTAFTTELVNQGVRQAIRRPGGHN